MKKILKPGLKTFIATCDRCLCEFTYTFKDLEDHHFVKCPECEHTVRHSPKLTTERLTTTNPCSNLTNCEECAWYKYISAKDVYIGDTPCQWCANSPYKVTCEATFDNSTTGWYTYRSDSDYMIELDDDYLSHEDDYVWVVDYELYK